MKTLHTLVLHATNNNQLATIINNSKHHVVDYPHHSPWRIDAGKEAVDALKALSLFQADRVLERAGSSRTLLGVIHPSTEVYEDKNMPSTEMVLYPARWEDKQREVPCIRFKVSGNRAY